MFLYPRTLGSHKCVKGKPHYIEVFSESDEEMVEEVEMVDGEYETFEEEDNLPQTSRTIVVLNGVP